MTRRPMTEEERYEREQERWERKQQEAMQRLMAAKERRSRRYPCADCGGPSDGFRYKDAPHYLCNPCVIARTVAAIQEIGGTSA